MFKLGRKDSDLQGRKDWEIVKGSNVSIKSKSRGMRTKLWGEAEG